MEIPTPINYSALDRTPRSIKEARQTMPSAAGLQTIPGKTFADSLNQAQVPTALTAEQERVKKINKTADDLVSVALILPMLKQLRRGSTNKDPVFGGGDGENAFGPEFDMHIADRIAQSPNLPVKKSLVDSMLNRSKTIDKRAYYQALGKGINTHG